MLSILVVVSLSPVRGPGPRATRIAAIGATWGQRVPVVVLSMAGQEDVAATTKACKDHGLPMLHLSNATKYSQYKALLRAVTENAAEWLFWANDHTFLVPERLSAYLTTLPREPVYVGSRLYGACCGIFNSGAAGFALNQQAMSLLLKDPKRPHCDPEIKRAHVATCLKTYGVDPVDSTVHGAERFHVYGPVRLATGSVDDWYISKKNHLPSDDTTTKLDIDYRNGTAHVARELISFHYVAAEEARLLDALIRGLHPRISSPYTHPPQLAQLRAHWPTGKLLGGYAHPWPSPRHEEKALLVAELLDRVQLTSGDSEPGIF